MTDRITTYADIPGLRTVEPDAVDLSRMTDGDIERLRQAARDETTYDTNGMNSLEGWTRTGKAVGEMGASFLQGSAVGVVGSFTAGAIDVAREGDAQRARADRLVFFQRQGLDELELRQQGNATPDVPDSAPAVNYDGNPGNDVAPSLTWDGRPAYETMGERAGG